MKLSGVREDTLFLRDMSGVSRNERGFAESLATMPLLLHPPKHSMEYEDYSLSAFNDSTAEQKGQLLRDEFAVLPRQLTYMDLRGADAKDKLTEMYFAFEATPNENGVLTHIECRMYNKDSYGFTKYGMRMSTYNEGNEVTFHYLMRGREIYTADSEELEFKNVKALMDSVATNITSAALSLCLLNAWAREHDQYPVIQQGTKRAQKGTKPCKRRDLPRLIYLNKLPSAHKQSQGGHHESPRGHERRGHYKTLRHTKYKHHPKYGIEKGIYVRPAWVGDKSVVREGNRYTVIL